jgi:hypothetical protein
MDRPEINLPFPTTLLRTHVWTDGRATLRVMAWPDVRNGGALKVIAELATSKHFPNNPTFTDLPDINSAIKKLNELFESEFPEHVCGNECMRDYHEMVPKEQTTLPQ